MFVARRLAAEPIVVFFGVRESSEPELDSLPELVLTGLVEADARLLLDEAVPGGVDEQVRDRIVAETRGNPLALLELPRGMTPAEFAGGFGLPTAHNGASRKLIGAPHSVSSARAASMSSTTRYAPRSDPGCRGEPYAELDRGCGARRCQLHDAEAFVGDEVGVLQPTQPLVELLGPDRGP